MALLICDIVSPNLWGMILNRVQIFTDQISDQCPWTMDQVIDQDVAQVVPNGYVPSKGVIGEHKDNLKLYVDSKLCGFFYLWFCLPPIPGEWFQIKTQVQIFLCDNYFLIENKEQCRCKRCRWRCKDRRAPRECKRCRPKARAVPDLRCLGCTRRDPWPAKEGDVEPWPVDHVVVEYRKNENENSNKWGCAWRNEERWAQW